MAFRLPASTLEDLRARLQARGGARKSMLSPSAAPSVVEAMGIVEEYGDMCEVLYLVMAADRRVLNVEREVMRGALELLSDGHVRTAHMDAMMDAAARRVAKYGEERCLNRCIMALRDDPVRAETTVVLAAAVAVADGAITPEEQELLQKLAAGLDIDEARAARLLEDLTGAD